MASFVYRPPFNLVQPPPPPRTPTTFPTAGATWRANLNTDITGLDVLNAYSHTMKAADNAGCAEETHQRIQDVVAQNSLGARFVTRVLGRYLELS